MIVGKLIRVNDLKLEETIIRESDLSLYLKDYEDFNRDYIIRCNHCNALLSIANKTKTIHYKLKRLSAEENFTEKQQQLYHKHNCKNSIVKCYKKHATLNRKYEYLKSDYSIVETLLYEFLTDKNNKEKNDIFLSDEQQNKNYFTVNSPYKIFRLSCTKFYQDIKDENIYYSKSKNKILGKTLIIRIDRKIYELNKTKLDHIYNENNSILICGILYKGEYNEYFNDKYETMYLNTFGTRITKKANIAFGN